MILKLVQQSESFHSKLFQGKHFKLLSQQITVESFELRLFARGSPIFIYNEFKFTGLQEHYYQYPNRINTFQWLICCLNSKTFQKTFFVIRNVIHFLAQHKEPLNKQNSPTRYYSTNLRFLEGFLVTTTTTQGVRFHLYITE